MKFIIKIIYKLVYQTNYRNFIAIFLFRLNLIPDEYKDRVRAMLKSKQYEKKFLKLNLSYDELGFYYLDPMPSKDFLKDYYEETYWHNRNDKFDLIYGSHSLEHVQNIKETIKKFNEISHENTIFFFEVPNEFNRRKISPPHTYYFTRKFFYNCFEKYDYCQTIDELGIEKNDEGDVIRFLSKHKISDTFLI